MTISTELLIAIAIAFRLLSTAVLSIMLSLYFSTHDSNPQSSIPAIFDINKYLPHIPPLPTTPVLPFHYVPESLTESLQWPQSSDTLDTDHKSEKQSSPDRSPEGSRSTGACSEAQIDLNMSIQNLALPMEVTGSGGMLMSINPMPITLRNTEGHRLMRSKEKRRTSLRSLMSSTLKDSLEAMISGQLPSGPLDPIDLAEECRRLGEEILQFLTGKMNQGSVPQQVWDADYDDLFYYYIEELLLNPTWTFSLTGQDYLDGEPIAAAELLWQEATLQLKSGTEYTWSTLDLLYPHMNDQGPCCLACQYLCDEWKCWQLGGGNHNRCSMVEDLKGPNPNTLLRLTMKILDRPRH
ncbi:hypothetical protein EDD85DRAFT_954788 [Armillaria nabsnona]|nr:hypothetical protein EDD85DRAFT_954788 [Armillaria nabsnona]